MEKCMLIGIAGGYGSGKTTFSQKLQERFARKIPVLYYEDYYRDYGHLEYAERTTLDYCRPDAFDMPLLVEHLRRLKAGQAIQKPVYDYEQHLRSKKTVRVQPSEVILVEGAMILEQAQLRELLDLKIFLDTEADERILRCIQREVVEHGRKIQAVISQYLQQLKPMHDRYVQPSKQYADIVVPGGGMNEKAVALVAHSILMHQNIMG